MQQITRSHVVNGIRLYAELLAAIPSLVPDSALPIAKVLIETTATTVLLTLPDAVPVAAVDAVLAKHDGTATGVISGTAAKARLRTKIQAGLTLADIKAALIEWLDAN